MVLRPLVFAVALLGLGGSREELVFAPEPGARLVRAWSEGLRLELDGLDMKLGGHPLKVFFEEVEFTGRRGFEVVDEVGRCADRRLLAFERAFDTGEMRFEFQVDGTTMASAAGGHACAESRVRFEHDEETDAYERELVEGPMDAELLDGLGVDMDLAMLLPTEELAEGATYTLEPELLRTFFAAGGELVFAPSELTAEGLGVPNEVVLAASFGSLRELFLGARELDGKVDAKYEGHADGNARLVLTLDLALACELDAKYSAFSLDDGGPAERQLRLAAELEGELLLLWDTTAHHLNSAKFAGEVTMEGTMAFPFRPSPDADPLDFEGSYELSGEGEVELAIR